MNVERGKKGFQRRAVLERFWEKVQKSDGCWNWLGATDGRYGQFFVNGGNVRAHRFAYEQANGPTPVGLWVLHSCDNPRCVRSEHLFLGTNADNQADSVRKGRHGLQQHPERAARGEKVAKRGTQNGRAKLSQKDVLEIRRRYALGHGPTPLARFYGIHPEQVRKIVNRENWGWLL